MNKPMIRCFSRKASEIYQNLLEEGERHADTIQHAELTHEQIDVISSKIFDNVFKYPQISLGNEKVDLSTETVDINEAGNFISNFSFGLSGSGITISVVTYKFDITGSGDALGCTVQFHDTDYDASLRRDSLILLFYFQGTDSDANAPAIKAKKDSIIAKFKDNNNDLKTYFEGKKEEFIEHIRTTVINKVSSNSKYKSDLSKF